MNDRNERTIDASKRGLTKKAQAHADLPRNLALLKVEAAQLACLQLVARLAITANQTAGDSVNAAKLVELQEMAWPMENIRGRIGKDRSSALFDYLILTGKEPAGLHPAVTAMRREYQLPCGRVDRLLEHDDCSFTVVEIKPSGSRRDRAHGIGQAILCAASMRAVRQDSADVRGALFTAASYESGIENACKSVGIEYIYMGRFERELIDELASIAHNGLFAPL